MSFALIQVSRSAPTKWCLVLVLLLLLVCVPSSFLLGTVIAKLSFDELVANADEILRGQVSQKVFQGTGDYGPRWLYVLEVHTVFFPAGPPKGVYTFQVSATAEGMPTLAVGDEVYVFVRKGLPPLDIVGGAQGIFRVERKLGKDKERILEYAGSPIRIDRGGQIRTMLEKTDPSSSSVDCDSTCFEAKLQERISKRDRFLHLRWKSTR